MRKIDCAELHLKLEEIQAKRKAMGDDFVAMRLEGSVNLPKAKKTHEEVKLLNQLIEMAYDLVGVHSLSARTKEGVEIKFELKERLKYWRKFYEVHEVNWIQKLPKRLRISHEQADAMEALMAEGFDYMLIIPAGLVDEYHEEQNSKTRENKAKNKKYADLHHLMSKSYDQTQTEQLYDLGGRFDGAQDLRQGVRILLTKGIQNLLTFST